MHFTQHTDHFLANQEQYAKASSLQHITITRSQIGISLMHALKILNT